MYVSSHLILKITLEQTTSPMYRQASVPSLWSRQEAGIHPQLCPGLLALPTGEGAGHTWAATWENEGETTTDMRLADILTTGPASLQLDTGLQQIPPGQLACYVV